MPVSARHALLLSSALVAFALAAGAQTPAPVDLILHNGHVFTADEQFRVAQALAVRDGRIVAAGGPELLKQFTAKQTIDLKGQTAIPGFIDAHIHIRGNPRHYVDLTEVKSIQEIRALVTAKTKELGKGQWVSGYGWSEDAVEEKRKPNRQDLDQAAPGNPVVLTRAGGHSSVGNSLALAAAKITRATPDPDRGAIEHDNSGEPTGIVRERNDLFTKFLPRADAAELRANLKQNLQALFAKGITSIIDAGGSVDQWPEWQKVYAETPDLPRAAMQIRWGLAEDIKRFGKKTGDGDDRLRVGAIKIFVDGGFTGPAAYTIAPYKNQGDYRGKLTMSEAALLTAFRQAHAMGWQLGLHTIGDGAIELAVNLLHQVLQEAPRADHRHYLNHFSMTPPEATYARMAADQIWIAQQPNFTFTLEGRYADYLDDARAQLNNPVATPIKRGIFLGFSSDILPIGPVYGLYAATTRKGMSGKVWGEAERISMADAIARYTRYAAAFTREEKTKGTLEPGKLADIVVLPVNPLTVAPEKLLTTPVAMTLVGGKVVYRASAAR